MNESAEWLERTHSEILICPFPPRSHGQGRRTLSSSGLNRRPKRWARGAISVSINLSGISGSFPSPLLGLTAASPLAPQMQQQELAQIRHREANLTALAAIGPRKKRKMDSLVRGAAAEVGGPASRSWHLKKGKKEARELWREISNHVYPYFTAGSRPAGFHFPSELSNRRLKRSWYGCCLLCFMTPGLRVVSLPVWRLQRTRLQTVYAPAHHQSQPQGPAFLPGERERDQSLTAAL